MSDESASASAERLKNRLRKVLRKFVAWEKQRAQGIRGGSGRRMKLRNSGG